MASRITVYGNPASPDVRRLKREMSVMYVESDYADPRQDARAARRLSEMGESVPALPIVEVLRGDDQGSVFLTNPDADPASVPAFRRDIVDHIVLDLSGAGGIR